jgi:hypothetical protein
MSMRWSSHWLVLGGYPGYYYASKTIEAVSKIRFYEMQYRKELAPPVNKVT